MLLPACAFGVPASSPELADNRVAVIALQLDDAAADRATGGTRPLQPTRELGELFIGNLQTVHRGNAGAPATFGLSPNQDAHGSGARRC